MFIVPEKATRKQRGTTRIVSACRLVVFQSHCRHTEDFRSVGEVVSSNVVFSAWCRLVNGVELNGCTLHGHVNMCLVFFFLHTCGRGKRFSS